MPTHNASFKQASLLGGAECSRLCVVCRDAAVEARLAGLKGIRPPRRCCLGFQHEEFAEDDHLCEQHQAHLCEQHQAPGLRPPLLPASGTSASTASASTADQAPWSAAGLRPPVLPASGSAPVLRPPLLRPPQVATFAAAPVLVQLPSSKLLEFTGVADCSGCRCLGLLLLFSKYSGPRWLRLGLGLLDFTGVSDNGCRTIVDYRRVSHHVRRPHSSRSHYVRSHLRVRKPHSLEEQRRMRKSHHVRILAEQRRMRRSHHVRSHYQIWSLQQLNRRVARVGGRSTA